MTTTQIGPTDKNADWEKPDVSDSLQLLLLYDLMALSKNNLAAIKYNIHKYVLISV